MALASLWPLRLLRDLQRHWLGAGGLHRGHLRRELRRRGGRRQDGAVVLGHRRAPSARTRGFSGFLARESGISWSSDLGKGGGLLSRTWALGNSNPIGLQLVVWFFQYFGGSGVWLVPFRTFFLEHKGRVSTRNSVALREAAGFAFCDA